MRWDCGPDAAEREEIWLKEKARLEEWHGFFALWPRRVGNHDCRWLERIERRGRFIPGFWDCPDRWHWEYRALSSPSQDNALK
jgi:hypothetical protein